jgi:hypothetical protein
MHRSPKVEGFQPEARLSAVAQLPTSDSTKLLRAAVLLLPTKRLWSELQTLFYLLLMLCSLGIQAQSSWRPFAELYAGATNITGNFNGTKAGPSVGIRAGILLQLDSRWSVESAFQFSQDNFTGERGGIGSVNSGFTRLLTEASVQDLSARIGGRVRFGRLEAGPDVGLGYLLSGRFRGYEISNGERTDDFEGSIGETVEGANVRYRISIQNRVLWNPGFSIRYQVGQRYSLRAAVSRTILADFDFLQSPKCANGADCEPFTQGFGSFGNVSRTRLTLAVGYYFR